MASKLIRNGQVLIQSPCKRHVSRMNTEVRCEVWRLNAVDTPPASGGGGGGGELANLFVPMSLVIVTSRREKRASSSSFRKWRRRHLQIQLFQAGFPTYSSFKVFCVLCLDRKVWL